MRFGICAPFSSFPLLSTTGWDYLEAGFASVLEPENPSPDILPALLKIVAETSLRPETWNGMLPGDLKVVGESVDTARIQRYLDTAFARASALGGKIVVFGSGGARRVPEGFSRVTAEQQLGEFLQRAGESAAHQGMIVTIEPLNRTECNILNSVAEATAMAQSVGMPAVTVLSDLYHVTHDGQSYAETANAGKWLTHVHIAGAANRRAPIAEDRDFLIPYFRTLKAMGYDGRISVEGGWQDLAAQAADTLVVLREAWTAA
jgi:sugar phosphate isomerase/epimerase